VARASGTNQQQGERAAGEGRGREREAPDVEVGGEPPEECLSLS
jgi:hypothetical protein